MPCRPKLCQRLAALTTPPPALPGSSNHIWISDELLAEAFNRYVRVSHTTRRYGSNVPGPLEARRRASRRRMGMAVAGAATGPPGGDFGALFGAGAGQPSKQNGWSWTSPGMQSDRPAPVKEPSSLWSWGAKKPEVPAEHERLLEIPQTGEQLVEASRVAFEELLCDCDKVEELCKEDVAGICDFLTSTADEPAARNVTRLVQWLACRSVGAMAWESLTALICDKIQLASLEDDELIQVIKVLPGAFGWQADEGERQQLHNIYEAFSASLLERNPGESAPLQAIFEEFCRITQSAQACSDLVERLHVMNKITNCENASSENISSTLLAISRHRGKAETQTELLSRLATALDKVPAEILTNVIASSTRLIVEKSEPGGEFVRAHALPWLQCLSANVSLRQSCQMEHVYTEFAKYIRPSKIAEHLGPRTISLLDMMRVMLNSWLPNTDLEKLQKNHENRSASSRDKGARPLQFGLHDLSAEDLPAVTDELERLIAAGYKPTWAVFLRAFARMGFSYQAIAHEVVATCKALYVPVVTMCIFVRMNNDPELALPASAAVSLIKHFLAINHPMLALCVFREVPSVAITDVPSLPLAVLNHRASTGPVFEMLLREPDAVPKEERGTYKLDVTPGHVEFVHLMAYDMANAAVLTPRQAYRCAWACYRWLQDRGAPLNPLISRAIVTAGILRPLNEHIWISTPRLDYILSIVEKVEGAEERAKVEMLAVRMRQAHHEGVLSKRRAKFQNSWMKGTRMRANEARFRLKKWSKKQPVPTEDGRSYWVPISQGYFSRGKDGAASSCVDPSPERLPIETVSMSEEVDELENWWRPLGEESLSRFDQLSSLRGDSKEGQTRVATPSSGEDWPSRLDEISSLMGVWDSKDGQTRVAPLSSEEEPLSRLDELSSLMGESSSKD